MAMQDPQALEAQPGESVPIIEMRSVSRCYATGDGVIKALDQVSFSIAKGEMVAIVGQSGSGKSTLLNVLGCLDRGNSGDYLVEGKNVASLSSDELAALRSAHFGFVFQRYHLLAQLTALQNVAMPAVYAGHGRATRDARATELLGLLGLADRLDHRPNALSGGQQQRVSIARALMNGGDVILADEPTGALDSSSGRDVLAILRALNAAGHTIIVVTHDPGIAAQCDRKIEISDGRIVSDHATNYQHVSDPVSYRFTEPPCRPRRTSFIPAQLSALGMAMRAIAAHRLRTFLTMLGIIIGICSVVTIVGLGEGARADIMSNINMLGQGSLDIRPGANLGDLGAGRINSLSLGDIEAIAVQPYVLAVTPNISSSTTAQFSHTARSVMLAGVGDQFQLVRGLMLSEGRWFNKQDIEGSLSNAIITADVVKELHMPSPVVGQRIRLGKMIATVVGVTDSAASMVPGQLQIFLPFSSLTRRITGGDGRLESISVAVQPNVAPNIAEQALAAMLTHRHGAKDFNISNNENFMAVVDSTSRTFVIFISSIAVITLVVGGIGVMNIMLVSVTERTTEIGLRLAVGARRSQIMAQFVTEAIIICLVGGAIGLVLSTSLGTAISLLLPSLRFIISPVMALSAFSCCTAVGLFFGYFPARRAAALDPVLALSRE